MKIHSSVLPPPPDEIGRLVLFRKRVNCLARETLARLAVSETVPEKPPTLITVILVKLHHPTRIGSTLRRGFIENPVETRGETAETRTGRPE